MASTAAFGITVYDLKRRRRVGCGPTADGEPKFLFSAAWVTGGGDKRTLLAASAYAIRRAKGRSEHMNAINVIAPYRYLDMWVFDDPRVGLTAEPFVGGADTMIDQVTADIPNAGDGFVMVFSSTPFPGHQFRLEWRGEERGGNVYYSSELEAEGWLCPALFRYFDETPADIYVQVKSKSGD